MDMGSDFDRLLFFEHARKAAEASYAKNPLDAENLTRWGGALIELSQFQSPGESKQMLTDAVSKLEEALEINPKKHDAMWCLANAHTTHAFMLQDIEDAKPFFQKAAVYFQQAAEEDPTNDLYKKSLEVSAKAPELHAEIHKQQSMGQQVLGGVGSSSSNPTSKTSTKKKKSSDFTYDVLGWVILAAGIVVWLGFAKNQAPPQPPR
ncbi:Mitochondrial import receptor subunit TOM20 [Bienertia sinuspersici]